MKTNEIFEAFEKAFPNAPVKRWTADPDGDEIYDCKITAWYNENLLCRVSVYSGPRKGFQKFKIEKITFLPSPAVFEVWDDQIPTVEFFTQFLKVKFPIFP